MPTVIVLLAVIRPLRRMAFVITPIAATERLWPNG